MIGENGKPHIVIDEQSFYLEIREIDTTTLRLLETWYQSVVIKPKENTKKTEGLKQVPVDIPEKVLTETSEESPATTTEKYCLDCKTTKPVDEFGKKSNTKDGHQTYCKICSGKRVKASHDKHSIKKKKSVSKPVKKPETPPSKMGQDPVKVGQTSGKLGQEPQKQEPKKTLSWTTERDQKLKDAFKKDLGPGGIYDADILPGFGMAEIRKRCQDLGLLDQYGLRPVHKKKQTDREPEIQTNE